MKTIKILNREISALIEVNDSLMKDMLHFLFSDYGYDNEAERISLKQSFNSFIHAIEENKTFICFAIFLPCKKFKATHSVVPKRICRHCKHFANEKCPHEHYNQFVELVWAFIEMNKEIEKKEREIKEIISLLTETQKELKKQLLHVDCCYCRYGELCYEFGSLCCEKNKFDFFMKYYAEDYSIINLEELHEHWSKQ